ncbi:MAG: HXXEE domain-containing protein [Chloroflexota bacterium]
MCLAAWWVFLWTGTAILPGNPTVAAFVLLLAFGLMLQNALQHIYYLFYFRRYAPGIVTSVLLLIPTIAYLVTRAVQQGYVPIWYAILLVVLLIPNLVQTVRARNTMLPSFQAIHKLGAALAKRF